MNDFRQTQQDEMPQAQDDMQPSDRMTDGQRKTLEAIANDIKAYPESHTKLQELIAIGSKSLASKIIGRCPGYRSAKSIAEEILTINY
jgi:hypothetical protein